MKGRESRWTSSESTSDESTTFSVRLAPRAIRDFDEAMDWLTAEASPEVAVRWATGLDKKIGTLATLPDRCPVARESDAFEEEVRQLLFGEGRGQYRVLFSIRGSEVLVHAIRRASREALKP
jgi:plasmid stabilization system protein ParE